MKFTISWLKEFLDTNASLNEISEALTDLGFEVDKIIDQSQNLKDFTVAYIKSTFPHPNASKLKICEVESLDSILQIICGAPNARPGIKVVLAKIGAQIPAGKFKIKESEIRGVKSYGMLCSEAELEIGKNSDGIIELPEDFKVGSEIVSYYGLDDPVIEINVTPNRSDALGVYGIARELAAKGLGRLKKIDCYKEMQSIFQSDFKIKIENFDACPLFAVREIKNLSNKETPAWLQKYLCAMGVKSISPIVDVTNYISYSFGQPMHAYDLDKLKSHLIIKINDKEQSFKALNDCEYNVNIGDLIICSDGQIECLAGIIGSNSSACDNNTVNIILEAAVFNPKRIARTGQRLQISSESRYRFERGVDREFTIHALNIASSMILEICGGVTSDIIHQETSKSEPIIIDFPFGALEKITGLKVEKKLVEDILEKLGFEVSNNALDDLMTITPPSWRHDIKIKEDIVEEIIRVHGYDKLQAINLPSVNIARIIPKYYRQNENIKRTLASIGYDEVITWSFMKDKDAEEFCNIKEELTIINPISADLNYMRPSIIPNLLKIIKKNQVRSIKNLSIFEAGPIFNGIKPEEETNVFVGVRCGMNRVRSWYKDGRANDAYDIKADIVSVITATGFDFNKLQVSNDIPPNYYHPGRSASLSLGKKIIAYFGQIHPKIQKIFDIDHEVFAFEFYNLNIPAPKKASRKPEFILSDFQISVRDFSFIIDPHVPSGQVVNFIRNIDKKLIKEVELFDVYVKNFTYTKSISLTVTIQSMDHTLTDSELSNLCNLIIRGVENKFCAKLRT